MRRGGNKVKEKYYRGYITLLHWSAIFENVVETGSSIKKGEKYEETTRERAVRWVGGWVGSSVLILLVCLCINYPELRTLRRAQPDYWLYYYLLQIINYRELRAKRGSRLGGDGGRYRGWRAADGCWEEKHPSQICVFN